MIFLSLCIYPRAISYIYTIDALFFILAVSFVRIFFLIFDTTIVNYYSELDKIYSFSLTSFVYSIRTRKIIKNSHGNGYKIFIDRIKSPKSTSAFLIVYIPSAAAHIPATSGKNESAGQKRAYGNFNHARVLFAAKTRRCARSLASTLWHSKLSFDWCVSTFFMVKCQLVFDLL